jgi:hypothetical protein
MMQTFAKHFDALQSAILGQESDELVERSCPCGSSSAFFRCQECFTRAPSCQDCILVSHQHLPFHRIEEWGGTHFARKELSALGLIIFLGHHTLRCPNSPPKSEGRPTVIVHTNGIHHTQIEYCHCSTAPTEALQLTSSGFFPATMDRPETAFTFALLKNFHVHTLTSKKSAYDFVSALQKLTDNAFPQRIPVSRSLIYLKHKKHWQICRDATLNFYEWHVYGGI